MTLDGDSADPTAAEGRPDDRDDRPSSATPACPVCGGRLIEIRGKLQCSVCRQICETCCEGGPP